jgi:hypothetical protein
MEPSCINICIIAKYRLDWVRIYKLGCKERYRELRLSYISNSTIVYWHCTINIK